MSDLVAHRAAYAASPASASTPAARAHAPPLQSLSPGTLAQVPCTVRRPVFDLASLRPGILHLGCGSFHRAHQALLTQRAIAAEYGAWVRPAGKPPPAWGIVAASLRSPSCTRLLQRQGGLYTVLERGPGGVQAEVVGALRHPVYAPEDMGAISVCFSDPAIRLVTLTVTAAGYCVDPVSGRLNFRHPDVAQDLRTPSPRSAIGILVKGLAQRRQQGMAPPVILSCDNLPANGRTLRPACIDHASLQDDGLAQWIDRAVQFPCSMVDRIVPTPTLADHDDAAAALGLADAAAVPAEPYCQWVLERFEGPRPFWEAAGVELVSDVAPWEASKLRLLNGGHLALAYLGLLAGYDTVADAAMDPTFTGFLLRLMLEEQAPTLPPGTHDIGAYACGLLSRWRNPGIAHQLERIGRDGSLKVPARLLAPLRDNLRDGRPAPCTFLVVAAWMRCVAGSGQDDGDDAVVGDRLPPEVMARACRAVHNPTALVDVFLHASGIFDDELRQHPLVRPSLIDTMQKLQQGRVHLAMARSLARRAM
ncbi:MAG: mannitol dehydrogenase family protein [Rubrivivax sp.]|nr:MAG: mannitol dehydrogenase family protein [Rubrivivax sp.]